MVSQPMKNILKPGGVYYEPRSTNYSCRWNVAMLQTFIIVAGLSCPERIVTNNQFLEMSNKSTGLTIFLPVPAIPIVTPLGIYIDNMALD
jgi:hypothetical protein